MYIDTYTNISDPNVLNKDITAVSSNVTVVLKDDTDIINPTIIMSDTVSQDFNYVYISEFDRYYYVNTRQYAQQRYYVKLSVDVLMSHQTDIEALQVIANRSSSRFNLYQIDDKVGKDNRNMIQTQNFRYGFVGETYVLAVNGGS